MGVCVGWEFYRGYITQRCLIYRCHIFIMFINFKKLWQAEENKALDLVLVSIDQHLMPLNIFQTFFFWLLFSLGYMWLNIYFSFLTRWTGQFQDLHESDPLNSEITLSLFLSIRILTHCMIKPATYHSNKAFEF